MCTDNMPSGSAMQLGDVLTMRNGTTVEVMNTDAEGRLVMADALALSTEDGADAIVDIATLTGACLRALGTEVAGVMGNDEGIIAQVRAAGEPTDEPVWPLPADRRYRNQLDSGIADMTNLGGPNAGSITAALFLEEFVGATPWAHIDIAGTAQAETTTRGFPKAPPGSAPACWWSSRTFRSIEGKIRSPELSSPRRRRRPYTSPPQRAPRRCRTACVGGDP